MPTPRTCRSAAHPRPPKAAPPPPPPHPQLPPHPRNHSNTAHAHRMPQDRRLSLIPYCATIVENVEEPVPVLRGIVHHAVPAQRIQLKSVPPAEHGAVT